MRFAVKGTYAGLGSLGSVPAIDDFTHLIPKRAPFLLFDLA
jgi:hypothetical protein